MAYTIVEVERGLGTVKFTIGVKNTGAGQGTGPVPIAVTWGDVVNLAESDFGRPYPGLGGTALVTVSLPLTRQQVQIETPHSLHQLEIDLRPIAIELTGHEIVGDGQAWLAMRASNRLPVRIEPTIVTVAWAPDADGDGSDHCEPPPEDPEFDPVISSLGPGEIQNLGVFSPVAVGSHTVYLCVYPLVENSRQELVWVATQLDVSLLRLWFEEDSIRHQGFDGDGNRIVQLVVHVANEGLTAERGLFLGQVCEGLGAVCPEPQLIASIPPGRNRDTLLTALLAPDETSVTAYIESTTNGHHQYQELAIEVPGLPSRAPNLDPESVIRGYWSDGSVDLDLLKVAGSAGVEIVQPGQQLVLACVGEFEGSATCVDPGSFNLPAGDLASMEPAYIRVPAGEYSIGFVPPIASSVETVVEVPARITGVDRTVWACVMDDSNVGQFREGDEGRGCAAWTEDFVVKWDQSKPVKVWTSGEPSWVAEFERTLAYVAELVGLELEPARNADEADLISRIGVPRIGSVLTGEACPDGVPGCAKVKIDDGIRLYKGRMTVHHREDEPSMEFDQMEELAQRTLRKVMLHELVHALSWMQHRTETGSAMESGVSLRVGLSPMDEALLRLQAHPLVEPGTTLPELGNLIIFSDELLDDSANTRFDSWRVVKDTYDMLRVQGSAEFAVTASSAGCAPQFGPALYQVGNITRRSGGYAWVRTTSDAGSLVTMDRTSEPEEYWSEYLGEWRLVSEQDHLEAAPGWRSDLADLHAILQTAFYHADWDRADIYPIGDGLVAVRLDINMPPATGNRRVGGALTLVIDELTGDLSEYDMSWRLSSDECDSFRVQATAVSFGRPFELPDAVRGRSAIIASCHLDLGQLEGAVSTSKSWERFCEPDLRSGVRDAFAASFGFSLSDWAIVRAEVESSSMNRLQLMGAPPGPEAVIDDRIGSPRWDGWVQKLLPPGSYSLQVSTDEVPVHGGFRIAVNGSKVAPPPHRARAIFAEGRHTCALLVDGSPVCWGWNLHGQAAPPEGEKFTQLAMTIAATCGLRSDSSVVCWGSEDSEVIENMPSGNELFEYITGGFRFVCGLRADGTVLCWGANGQGQLDTPQGAVFAAVAAGPSHVCGLRPDGSPTCWGLNIHAQSDAPKNARFVSISAGDRHSCGLRADGSVDCWGSGGSAECVVKPDGSTSCRYDAEDSAPAPPDGVVLTSFSLGQPFCGLTSDGEPICWGRDERGQASPPEGERFTALSASGTNTCGLREDGTISCWGWDQFGQASPPLAGH